MMWFLANRPDLARHISWIAAACRLGQASPAGRPVARARWSACCATCSTRTEFLSPYGVRSLSRGARGQAVRLDVDGDGQHRVDYVPGESNTGLFGGNSNWRGPIWFPLNYLLIEALERYHHFYGDDLQGRVPDRLGPYWLTCRRSPANSAAADALFLPDEHGRRARATGRRALRRDPHWRTSCCSTSTSTATPARGLGASHQTGWTALVVKLLEDRAHDRVPPR
jgi:hypothetical protein